MRVKNKTSHGVFVANYGVIAAEDEATVRESEQVKQLINDGVLSEVKATANTDDKKEGGDAA